jgi:hypothetical protein
MSFNIERACFEQIARRLKNAGEWVFTRGWQQDPPNFKSARIAADRLLAAYPQASNILTMRFAMLRVLRELVLERGLNLLVPVKDDSDVFQVPRSALFAPDAIRVRESLAIHPPPPGSEIYTGEVDVVVTGCLAFNPNERRLYALDNERGAYLQDEWRDGLPNSFRIPRSVPVVAIAADVQQVEGWPPSLQSFLEVDFVYTPNRSIKLGAQNPHLAQGVAHIAGDHDRSAPEGPRRP